MTSRAFFHGGGETGALMRSLDWSKTPLGPVSGWPQSLLTTVGICLHSRFPILIWWGPGFVKLYNDAYRRLLGSKHPRAMGAPGREVWPEIWHIIGPMLDSVVRDGQATWSEDQMLPLERHGYAEECYFTFSYSPIHDESGGVGGVFCAVTETTGRVIGERRLRLLQELAGDAAGDTEAQVCARTMGVLARDTADVPFALIYLLTPGQATPQLAGATGIAEPPVAPPWGAARALDAGAMTVVDCAGAPVPQAFAIPIARSDGSATALLVAGISPHIAVDDRYRGFATLLAREIGGSLARARALEDEKRRAAALAEIDRVKTTFFSNVSHEFRTPLTLMLSPLQDALDAPERALRDDDLVTVHRNALRLLKLVNTMLDFARIEAGRMRAVFEPTDLAQLTADLASAFRSAMAQAGLQFDVDCPPVSAPVHVDRDSWEKIVLNLLSNALKFTFEGGVRLSLRERDGRVELAVRDTGIGIADSDLTKLFTRFHRVHGARARTHEGSGIGLALVQELVKMHGGELAVASEPGAGTTFTVSVPLGTSHLPPDLIGSPRAVAATRSGARPYVEEALRWTSGSAEPTTTAAAEPGAHALRIVVADDNADMRDYITRLLRDRWIVTTVADGAEALAAIQAAPPALVITDVMMPRLDGFGLLRELRANPRTRDLPIIMLSARAGEEASIEGLEAGADDYVVKPFSARELRARVEAQLLRSEIRAIEAAHDRRLADIFRYAPVAIAILRGPDHVYDFVNDPYAELIGRRPVLGRPIREALPELGGQGVFELLDQVYATGQPLTAESFHARLDRGRGLEDEYFNFVYQPLRDRDGRIEGVAVVATEVTELVSARRDAESANTAKDEFLAILGHELRNPLSPILAAVRLLQLKGTDDAPLVKARGVILRQAMQMTKLVDDLLDAGRIVTGKLRLEKQRVELGAVLKQAVDASTPIIQERRHSLTMNLPEQPVWLEADAGRLMQVVCNLLNNAAKYMPEQGRIELTASEEGGTVSIRVRDEGVGIDPEMRDRIFDRFVQIGSSDHRSQGGLGIGLSLVKAIVELHGGTVAVHSDGIGRGSEFVVRVPAAVASAEGESEIA